MTDGTDETERFEGDDAVAGAGYRLVASWGPQRWRLGGHRPSSSFVREVAYAPDGETFFFAVGNVVVELDRQGRPARAPCVVSGENVSITIAENGRRAAILRAGTLSVVELPSMREIVRVEARPSLYSAVISWDVAAGNGAEPRSPTRAMRFMSTPRGRDRGLRSRRHAAYRRRACRRAARRA